MFDNLIVRDDIEQAFCNAIRKGLDSNKYMYMHSTRWFDYFKHIDTRGYTKYFNLFGGIKNNLITMKEHRSKSLV